jgi:hypothetical protein
MRLIDADALRDQISETYEHEFPTASGGFDEFATKIIPNVINNAITVDAVPVVRGYSYEDDKTYSGPGTSNYICSVCGEMQGTWKKGLAQNQKFKFCPWCGAKMEDKP